jgi:hypothetical protein
LGLQIYPSFFIPQAFFEKNNKAQIIRVLYFFDFFMRLFYRFKESGVSKKRQALSQKAE